MADEADVFRRLDRVSIDSATHVLRVLHELGRSDAPRSSRPGPDPAGTRDLVFDVARLFLTGYEEFLRLQERYFDVVADGLRDLGRPWTSEPAAARERLAVEGPVGGTARGRFRLENEQDVDVDLSFRFGEFAAAHDERRFPAAISVRLPAADVARAADRRLAAGERRVFEVAVHLDPATFQPYRTYVGDIQVLRDGRTVAELTLEVSAKP
jgi:hypothetical protein